MSGYLYVNYMQKNIKKKIKMKLSPDVFPQGTVTLCDLCDLRCYLSMQSPRF